MPRLCTPINTALALEETCDAHGNPTGFYLTDGQAHDLNGADALMDHFVKADAVLTHKAYDADERMRDRLKEKKPEAVIPP